MIQPADAVNVGQGGNIVLRTGTSGTNDLTWADNSHWYFEAGTGPSITQTANVYDVFSYLIVANNTVLISSAGNFSQG